MNDRPQTPETTTYDGRCKWCAHPIENVAETYDLTCPSCGRCGDLVDWREHQTTRRPLSVWEHERLIREARLSLPTMPRWSLQPEADTPGLFIQCQTVEQREKIMRALGCVDHD